MTAKELNELGNKIDYACDMQNEEALKLIIKTYHESVENLLNSKEKAIMYYFLANSWSGLRRIRHIADKSSIWLYEQEELNNEIVYLRKAKKEKGFSELKIAMQLSVLTNLANIFSHTGRTIYAVKLYDEIIEKDDTFFMALANRGECLLTYSTLDYDDGHESVFIHTAYRDMMRAVEVIEQYEKVGLGDKEYYKSAKREWLHCIQRMKERCGGEFLDSDLKFDNFSLGESSDETFYRQWVLDNTLFLNSMNDLSHHNMVAHDPLNLPTLVTDKSKGFPKYITYFNQIKQEFISYRHLLYEGVKKKTKPFYDKETLIINDHHHNINNIDTEKIKLAFRGMYSIFDKIAYFLNEYFELSFDKTKVDFRRIWKDKDNQKLLNPKLGNLENLALRGLYFISKDLFFGKDNNKLFFDVLEPKASNINKIRNHLEHNFLNIKMEEFFESRDREKIESISLDALEEMTLHLSSLIREAIIYLSFCVHIEEKKKNKIYSLPQFLSVKG